MRKNYRLTVKWIVTWQQTYDYQSTLTLTDLHINYNINLIYLFCCKYFISLIQIKCFVGTGQGWVGCQSIKGHILKVIWRRQSSNLHVFASWMLDMVREQGSYPLMSEDIHSCPAWQNVKIFCVCEEKNGSDVAPLLLLSSPLRMFVLWKAKNSSFEMAARLFSGGWCRVSRPSVRRIAAAVWLRLVFLPARAAALGRRGTQARWAPVQTVWEILLNVRVAADVWMAFHLLIASPLLWLSRLGLNAVWMGEGTHVLTVFVWVLSGDSAFFLLNYWL